jgi:PAS domain S-box-containing protein
MNTEPSYEVLLKQYRELQLRVTRFSFVEQQLINTRDRMDHELVMYRRLSNFNVLALNEISEQEFFKRIAEAIVDIFELEAGVFHIRRINQKQSFQLVHEGLELEPDQLSILGAEISLIGEVLPHNAVINFIDIDRSRYNILNKFSSGLCYQFDDEESGYVISLMGLISQPSAPLYGAIEERHQTFFNVFINQVISIVSNRRKSERIQDQINKISKSELELKKLSMIATKTRNGVVISDAQGRIEWVNAAFTTITGYEFDEVIGLKPKDFLQRPDVDQDAQAQIREALWKNESIEVTIQNFTKSGSTYFNNLQITPILDDKGALANFIAIQRDITKEKRFQEDLMHVNSKFELITRKANIGIWEWDALTYQATWNDVLRAQYGLNDGDETRNFAMLWREAIHPDDNNFAIESSDRLINGLSEFEELEYRIIRRTDDAVRILSCLTIAERDSNGQLQRLIGSSTDVTDLRNWQSDIIGKNEELKKINSELDNFVYRVSHDLRSPLLAIKGLFSLIFGSKKLDAEILEYLNLAEGSVNRLDETIQEILEYSRNSRLAIQYEEFDVLDIVNEVYTDLRFSSEKDLEFKIVADCSTLIFSDKTRIKVLFKNLLGNAFKYRKKNIENPYVHFTMNRDADTIYFEISDNGEGISKLSLSKVFDMFYRGTTTSVGTGLGLYICKEVVSNLNGTIQAESEQGVGTTMLVSLPAYKHG